MLKLYAVPVSLYCAKTRIMLRHKQLDFVEELPPGGYGSDEYRRLVPAGNLPALMHDEFLISDSEAIAEYLNETFDDPDMLPGSPRDRAMIRQLSRFHDTRLEPAVRALFPFLKATSPDQDRISDLWENLSMRAQQIDALLPESTTALTLADCGLAVTGVWIDIMASHLGRPHPASPAFADYLRHLEHHPAVEAELAAYRPRLANWLTAP